MIKKKRKGKEKKIIYRESGNKMNGLLTPALTSPHSKHHPIYLFRKYSNVSRKVSGPVVGVLESAQAQIWPYSCLYFVLVSTIVPSDHKQPYYGDFIQGKGFGIVNKAEIDVSLELSC